MRPALERPASTHRFGRESAQLRALAIAVLVLGIGGAAVNYWLEMRAGTPALDELTAPGYQRAREAQVGRMMGHFGLTLTEWQDALDRPGVESGLIAAVALLVGWVLFRIARSVEADERAAIGRNAHPPS